MKQGYTITLERGDLNHSEMHPIYVQHYSEMQARLLQDGITIGDYNPRLPQYIAAWQGGWLLNYIVRFNGVAVGYGNVYLTNDMHNSELIAQEDAIYLVPEHRNGMGKTLVKFILADLTERGVVRVNITPATDLRVAKIWKRMGFKETATVLTYHLKE